MMAHEEEEEDVPPTVVWTVSNCSEIQERPFVTVSFHRRLGLNSVRVVHGLLCFALLCLGCLFRDGLAKFLKYGLWWLLLLLLFVLVLLGRVIIVVVVVVVVKIEDTHD
jgi:hypothetical protein